MVNDVSDKISFSEKKGGNYLPSAVVNGENVGIIYFTNVPAVKKKILKILTRGSHSSLSSFTI